MTLCTSDSVRVFRPRSEASPARIRAGKRSGDSGLNASGQRRLRDTERRLAVGFLMPLVILGEANNRDSHALRR